MPSNIDFDIRDPALCCMVYWRLHLHVMDLPLEQRGSRTWKQKWNVGPPRGPSSGPRLNPHGFALHLQVGRQHAKIEAQKLHSSRSTHILHNVSIFLLSISITQRESDAGGMIADDVGDEVTRLTALQMLEFSSPPCSFARALDDCRSNTVSRNSIGDMFEHLEICNDAIITKTLQNYVEPCMSLNRHIAVEASSQPMHL
jgi:hypothetical protein